MYQNTAAEFRPELQVKVEEALAIDDSFVGDLLFQRFNALPWETVARGLIIGTTLMIGSRLAKGFVLRLDAHQFRTLMDCLLAGAGLLLLLGAFVLPH